MRAIVFKFPTDVMHWNGQDTNMYSWYEGRTLKTLREEWKNRRNEGMKDREEEEIGRNRDEEM